MNALLVWGIAAGAMAGVLFRPRGWPEAVWACVGAVFLVAGGLLPISLAASAVAAGVDVYLFLTGMMLLAELARREGVFDWLAALAVRAAHGSRRRLFSLIYGVGIVVTVFLSNDATAVVLTPAVYAAVKKARVAPLPYLFICALIANAASFALPLSNPANLVVYGKSLPPLLSWMAVFLFPSICSIAVTYLILRWYWRGEMQGALEAAGERVGLSHAGKRALGGIVATGAILMTASALGTDLGLPTCLAALLSVLIGTGFQPRAVKEIARGVAWSVLPLVAGLFILVEAVNRVGALSYVGGFVRACSALPALPGALASSLGIAALSNLVNNLPSGLLAGDALKAVHPPALIRNAVLIGIDLGPNLSVTGSLATVLWLVALRREGEQVTGWRFLKLGALIMPPALVAAVTAAWLMSENLFLR